MFWSSLLKNLWIRLNHLKSNFHALATARDPRAFTRTVPLWLRSFGQTWESVLSVSVSFNCWRLNRCYLVSFHCHNAIGISNAAFQVHPPRDFSWVCIFPVGCCKFSSPSGRDQPDFCLASAMKWWLKHMLDPRKKRYTPIQMKNWTSHLL